MNRLILAFFGAMLWLATQVVAAAPPNFVIHDAPKPLPELAFTDGTGAARTLAEFKGKVVLLNVWATWCIPCRKEMPTLDRLQAKLGGPGFEVVALSIDRGGIARVKEFYTEIGISNLAIYVDTSGRAASEFGIFGLPGTLLLDREGREIGRLIGPAEWDSPEMMTFLKPIIAPATKSSPSAQQKETTP